jgi:hypothetical protein
LGGYPELSSGEEADAAVPLHRLPLHEDSSEVVSPAAENSLLEISTNVERVRGGS